MNIVRSAFYAVLIVFVCSLFSVSVYASDLDIKSFSVVQVCTEYQCVDTTSNPYSATLIGGSQLRVYVQQIGYAQFQSAKYNNNTVRSIDSIKIDDNYGFTIGFLDVYDCSGYQTGTFQARAVSTSDGNEWTATINITIKPLLSVNTLGTGSGTVTPDTGTLSWNGNIGTANFPTNTQVILTPTESAGSTFYGWSGACTNTSGTCTVTMNANKSVSATFTVIPNARIGSAPYGTLNSAYSVVGADSVIEAKAITFTENLILNRDVPFTLRGGYRIINLCW